MSPLPRKILVIGSGIAGPVFATFMLLTASPAASKPHITVLERAPFVRSQGQNVDIRGAGVTIMRKLGLETAIRSCVTGEEGVMFVDTHNNTIATGPADKTGKVQTGTSDIEILRGTLADICYKRCVSVSDEVEKEGGAGVDFVFGDYAEKIEQHGNSVLVTFAKSGERKSYDLVVGADGLLSSTRGLVWGEEGEEERLHRLGVNGGFFNMPRGETDTMWRRWYRAPGGKGIMVRPSDTPDKTTVFMLVCNDKDVRFREVTTKRPDVQKQKQLLTEYFEGAGWECDRVVKELNAADDFYYSMIAQVKMEKWSKGRVVLVGDAGYCASPISGMGTTLAFNGAYNLAGALTQHSDDIDTALAVYETSMRPVADLAQALPFGGRGIKLIHPQTAWGISILHTIMWFITWSGIASLMFRFKVVGPPADEVKVEEFGFRVLPDTPV